MQTHLKEFNQGQELRLSGQKHTQCLQGTRVQLLTPMSVSTQLLLATDPGDPMETTILASQDYVAMTVLPLTPTTPGNYACKTAMWYHG